MAASGYWRIREADGVAYVAADDDLLGYFWGYELPDFEGMERDLDGTLVATQRVAKRFVRDIPMSDAEFVTAVELGDDEPRKLFDETELRDVAGIDPVEMLNGGIDDAKLGELRGMWRASISIVGRPGLTLAERRSVQATARKEGRKAADEDYAAALDMSRVGDDGLVRHTIVVAYAPAWSKVPDEKGQRLAFSGAERGWCFELGC